jgi:very-short-patch-repair endonuclease
MRKVWKEEEVEFLKKLYIEQGLVLKEICEIFKKKYNRTKTAINLKIKKLKLKHTKEQTYKAKSRNNSGKKNGMYGKTSKLKGLNKENSKMIKDRSLKMSKTKQEMSKNGLLPDYNGIKNPMYGKKSWCKGLTKHTNNKLLSAGVKISKIQKEIWGKKTKEEKSRIISRLNNAMIQTKKPTLIEIKMEDFLKKENLNYEKNFNLNGFKVDFFLPDYNFVIECDGDYWHGNPQFYMSKNLDKIQLKNLGRDKRKNEMLLENKINFIRFWEYDIHNNFNKIEKTIWHKLRKI